MIYTDTTSQPASEIIKSIVSNLRSMRAQIANVNEASIGANILMSISMAVNSTETFLLQFAGNQRAIDYANAEAALNTEVYGEAYDVHDDFVAVLSALSDIKQFIIAQDFSDAVTLDESGVMVWKVLDASGLQVEIDKFLAVVN